MDRNCQNCTEKCPQAERANQAALGRMYATKEFTALLKKVESGELVEVVRCKDCKHWQPIHEHIPHMECQIFCGAYEHGYPTNADDFCSYGERRTDERKAD